PFHVGASNPVYELNSLTPESNRNPELSLLWESTIEIHYPENNGANLHPSPLNIASFHIDLTLISRQAGLMNWEVHQKSCSAKPAMARLKFSGVRERNLCQSHDTPSTLRNLDLPSSTQRPFGLAASAYELLKTTEISLLKMSIPSVVSLVTLFTSLNLAVPQ
ncbi:12357_t:CDS:2, partial [Acaulospora colombiana]